MSKPKILYIEDELSLAKIVSETLGFRGYEMTVYHDGRDILSRFEKVKPDLCIFDVMLPVKDGFSLAKEIRTIHPHIPIIFLTAKSQTEDTIEGFRSGGNDYIRKPFSIEELSLRIDNLLQLTNQGMKSMAEKETLGIGRYTLDFTKQILYHPNKERRITYREARLLKMLMSNKNEVVIREHILKEIWGDDSFFNSRTLDVYITKLRGYIKEDEEVKIITLKGVGYRMIE